MIPACCHSTKSHTFDLHLGQLTVWAVACTCMHIDDMGAAPSYIINAVNPAFACLSNSVL